MAADNIIETMTDYLIVVDKDLNVALANASILDALGKKKEEMEGKPIRELS
jgi:PAS domain S-box-containing protein